MLPEQMRKAAEITYQMSISDEELKLAIQGNALALAFLEGKGWGLAITPLRLEREQLKRYLEARKR